MLSFVVLSAILFHFAMLNVSILSVAVLNVVASFQQFICGRFNLA
jgi:hypothetical protein